MNKNHKNILIGLCLLLSCQLTLSYAWWEPRPFHHHRYGLYVDVVPVAATTLIFNGLEYYYIDGEFYRYDPFDGYVVVSAPIGVVVPGIPQGYQPITIDGTTYYIIDGVTYKYAANTYQVVPTPKVATQSTINQMPLGEIRSTSANNSSTNNFTVNVPNSKGGYTTVVLKHSGTGFIGPQGEYYNEFPSIDQLKVMYAK